MGLELDCMGRYRTTQKRNFKKTLVKLSIKDAHCTVLAVLLCCEVPESLSGFRFKALCALLNK